MEETPEQTIIKNTESVQYGLISIDQNIRQDKTSNKHLSNTAQVLNSELNEKGVDYAHKKEKDEQSHDDVSLTAINKTSATHVESNGERKKKNKTPPKFKNNFSCGNQRVNNKQRNGSFDSQIIQEDNLHINDSLLYEVSTCKQIRGSRKNNLNHLLNFTYEKSSNEHYEYQKFSKQFWTNRIAKNSYFTKEQFLQANCRFVVKSDEDYSSYLINPDLLVDWSKIEEIHIDSNELISCPICLYYPTVGKMTKCGHIFCWSCILHYLSLSDKSWRKCPICYECIYKADLKSLIQNQFENNFKVDDKIEFELMFRSKSKISSVYLPYVLFDQFKLDEQRLKTISLDLLNSDSYLLGKKYLKIVTKSCSELLESIIYQERIQLNMQRENEKDQPEICFVDEALRLLDDREVALKNVDDNKKKHGKPDKIKILHDIEKLTINESQDQFKKTNTETNDDYVTTKRTSQHGLNDIQDYFIFYQSSDGQRIYMNAMNTRMLLSEYSVFTNFPKYLTAKIISAESYFMSEENRKRFKYLSHLPLNSEFKVVEVELTEKYVSKKTLNVFEEEVLERKRLRDLKLLKEKRLADKLDNKNTYDPHYYNISAMNEPITSTSINTIDYCYEFPEASTSPTTSSSGISSGISSGSSVAQLKEHEQTPASFAQMAKNQVINNVSISKNSQNLNSTITWPSLDKSYPALNLPQQKSQLTNGWLSTAKMCPTLGRSIKAQAPPSPWLKNSLTGYENEEIDEADYMPAPGYRESFFSAIDEIFDSNVGEIPDDVSLQSKFQVTKKKKKSKKLLFST